MAVNLGEIFSVIGADTSPLVKSQKTVDSITKSMEKSMLEVSKQGDKLLDKVNTSGMDKAKNSVNINVAQMQGAMGNVSSIANNLLKNVNTSGMTTAGNIVDKTAKSMQDGLNKVSKDGKELLNNVPVSGVNKAESSVDKAAKAMQDDFTYLDENGKELLSNVPVKGIDEAKNKVTSFADSVSKSFERIGEKLIQTGDRMKQFGSSMTMLTAPIAAVGAIAFKSSNDFNEAMSKVATLIPGQTQKILEYKKAVQELAVTYGKAPKDIADGLYMVISAFGDTSDTLKNLESNVKASTAGFTEAAAAVELTSGWTKAYGDTSAEAVNKANDLAFKIVELGVTDYPQLARSMGEVLPAAAALGVKQEELAASYATLTGVTGNASKVTTQLNATFVKLLAPTDAMTKALSPLINQMVSEGKISGNLVNQYYAVQNAMFKTAEEMEILKSIGQQNTDEYRKNKDNLKELNKEYQTATAGLIPLIVQKEGYQKVLLEAAKAADGNTKKLVEMIGSEEALKGVLALIGPQADTYIQKMQKMYEATGANDKALNEVANGINKTGFQWKQLGAQIKVLTEQIGDELGPTMLDLMENIINPLIKDNIVPAIKEFNSWDDSTKKLVVSLGGIATILGPVIFVLGAFVSSIGTVITGIGKLIPLFSLLLSPLKIIGPLILKGVIAAFTALISPIGITVVAIGSIIVALTELIIYWDDVKWAVTEFGKWIVKVFKEMWEGIKTYAKLLGEVVVENLREKLSLAKKWISEIAKDTVDYWKNVPTRITQYAKEIYLGVKTWLVDKFQAIVNWVREKVAMIREAFAAVADAVVLNSIVPDMITAIGDEFYRLEKLMVDPVEEYANTIYAIYDDLAKKIIRITLAPDVREYYRLADVLSLINGVPTGDITPVGDANMAALIAEMDETLSYTENFINDMSDYYLQLTTTTQSFINDMADYFGQLSQAIGQNLLNVIGSGGPFDQFITSLIDINNDIIAIMQNPGQEFEDSFTTALDNIIDYFNDNFMTGMNTGIMDFVDLWKSKLGNNFSTPSTMKGDWGLALDSMYNYFSGIFNTGSPSVTESMNSFLSNWSDFANAIMFAWESALNYVATGTYNTGGMVEGYAVGGKVTGPGGKDKVPAWLTAGEFVVSKPAVDHYGQGILEEINRRKFLDGGIVNNGIINTLQKPHNEVMTMPSNQNSFTVGAPMLNSSSGYMHWLGGLFTANPDGSNSKTLGQYAWWNGSTWNGAHNWGTLLMQSDLMAPTGWYCDDLYGGGISTPPYDMGNSNHFSEITASGFNKAPILQTLGNRAASTYTDAWFPTGFYDYAGLMGINIDDNWLNPSLNYHTGGLTNGGLINTLPDEYVINPSAVSRYGTDMMDEINEGRYSKGDTIHLNINVSGSIIDSPSERRRFVQYMYDELDKLNRRTY